MECVCNTQGGKKDACCSDTKQRRTTASLYENKDANLRSQLKMCVSNPPVFQLSDAQTVRRISKLWQSVFCMLMQKKLKNMSSVGKSEQRLMHEAESEQERLDVSCADLGSDW